jgi:hypothetical protein
MASIPFYTLSAHRDNAGMSASGFRRATSWNPEASDWTDVDDGMFAHGLMQEGDIIGPWILDDLQRAFDALRWTYGKGSIADAYIRSGSGATRSDAIAAFNADSWLAGSVYGFYQCYASNDGAGTWFNSRAKGKVQVSSISTHVAHAADAYGFVTDSGAGNFVDRDSFGATENEWYFLESFSADTVDTRTTATYGAIDTAPLTAYSDGAGTFADAIKMGDALPIGGEQGMVLKWSFTHTRA